MQTLEDLLTALDRMDVEPYEIELSRDAYSYFIREAQKIIAAEEEEEEVE